MTYKNISFISFDIRKHKDYWMRDMLMQPQQFAQAIQQNHQFPAHFYTVSGESLLNHLKARYKSTSAIIHKLAIDQDQYLMVNKQVYNKSKSLIIDLLQKYQ